MTEFNNFGEWAKAQVGIVRIWVYKRMFTPYEQSEKFTDQSEYEDTYAQCGIIESVVNLGYDWLIGLRVCDDDGKEYPMVEYYRLSEIRMDIKDRGCDDCD